MNPFGVVADQPGELVPLRQSVDKGPKTHALHDTPHRDLPALLGGRSHGVAGPLAGPAIGFGERARAHTILLRIDLLKLIRSPCSLPVRTTVRPLTTSVLHL